MCPICPSKFFQRGYLNNHIASTKHIAAVHAEHKHEMLFDCSLCTYRFGNKELLDRHIAAAHEKNKLFECSLCPRKFGLEDHLNKHIDAVHKRKKP